MIFFFTSPSIFLLLFLHDYQSLALNIPASYSGKWQFWISFQRPRNCQSWAVGIPAYSEGCVSEFRDHTSGWLCVFYV